MKYYYTPENSENMKISSISQKGGLSLQGKDNFVSMHSRNIQTLTV